MASASCEPVLLLGDPAGLVEQMDDWAQREAHGCAVCVGRGDYLGFGRFDCVASNVPGVRGFCTAWRLFVDNVLLKGVGMCDMAELERVLWVWGDWYRGQVDGGVGFPRQTVLGRFADDGGVITMSAATRVLPCNSDAERVEMVVCQMRRGCYELWADVLLLKYVQGLSNERAAKRLVLSLSSYKILLARALAYVVAVLELIEQSRFGQDVMKKSIDRLTAKW